MDVGEDFKSGVQATKNVMSRMALRSRVEFVETSLGCIEEDCSDEFTDGVRSALEEEWKRITDQFSELIVSEHEHDTR